MLTFTHAVDIVNAAIEIRNFMAEHKKKKEAKPKQDINEAESDAEQLPLFTHNKKNIAVSKTVAATAGGEFSSMEKID